jgi:chromate transport protein ChrA
MGGLKIRYRGVRIQHENVAHRGRANVNSEGSFLEVLSVATRFGLTSLGGSIAHLGYFHDEYVVRRKSGLMSTATHLVALCQFFRGPGDSYFS